MRAKKSPIPISSREREKMRAKLPSKVYGVPWVSLHRAKNKSSLHRREVCMGTLKEGFRQRSKRGDFGKSKLSGLRGLLPLYHIPRGKGFFLPWPTFHFLARKIGFFG